MCQSDENRSLQEQPVDLSAAFGTSDRDLQAGLITQVVGALWLPLEGDDGTLKANAAIAALKEMKPQDVFEGQLAAQMVATHDAAMERLKRATKADHNMASVEINLRLAAKFLVIYLQQLEGLDRHRGKGTPKVNVGAVNVGAGGQAIVGSVETKPRRKRKNPSHRPSIPAIESNPVTPLDLGPPIHPTRDEERIKHLVSRESDEPAVDA